MALYKISLREIVNGKGLFADDNIGQNEVLIDFSEGKTVISKPTKLSTQVAEGVHWERTSENIAYLNHSCQPNAYFDKENGCFRALGKIVKNEEVTFNYLTTEADMHTKFRCNCGSENCFGFIKGYKYLTQEELKKVKEESNIKTYV